MDRSFLSNEAVISASRSFVCIRCATYEDAQEAEFLKWIFASRNGDLENTVFCILSPDATQKLIRGARGPMQFRGARDMAEQMDDIAADYPQDIAQEALPQLKNLRLGINVAACDNLPAVVVMSSDETKLTELKTKLAGPAWDPETLGMFIFCSTTNAKDLSMIKGLKRTEGFAIVAPDAFGQEAQVLQELTVDATAEELKSALAKTAAEFERPLKDHRRHVRAGRDEGVNWETEIPVTDSHALQAEQRRKKSGK